MGNAAVRAWVHSPIVIIWCLLCLTGILAFVFVQEVFT